MLGSAPYLLKSRVWHARRKPKHAFTYHVYYLAFNPRACNELRKGPMRVNGRGLLSYHDEDHGERTKLSAYKWAENTFRRAGIAPEKSALVLITMPRVLGYVFNPVSFWLLLDGSTTLRAVIAEVNNTFGETHSYVLAHSDGRNIEAHDILKASKHFHVSPFMHIEGDYHFSFALEAATIAIRIDHVDAVGATTLKTTLTGTLMPYTAHHLWRMFWCYPLVTLKVIALIHYQAVCLLLKKVRYNRKPEPPAHEVTTWHS